MSFMIRIFSIPLANICPIVTKILLFWQKSNLLILYLCKNKILWNVESAVQPAVSSPQSANLSPIIQMAKQLLNAVKTSTIKIVVRYGEPIFTPKPALVLKPKNWFVVIMMRRHLRLCPSF